MLLLTLYKPRAGKSKVGGHLDSFELEVAAMAQVRARVWKSDYISIRKRIDLQPPSAGDLALKCRW
jgi:hypothetical protein